MYDVEATVTETGPTVLKLTADWPVDWLRATGLRTMEIQRELFHGEILETPSVPTERREIVGNRANWRNCTSAIGWSSGASSRENAEDSR
jgi:hypothetical protein